MKSAEVGMICRMARGRRWRDAKRTVSATNADPPAGLTAERFVVDGTDFVLFTWSTSMDLGCLSATELAVATRIAAGAANAEIAAERATSVRTIANQVASILRKLGLGSRYELIARFPGAKSS